MTQVLAQPSYVKQRTFTPTEKEGIFTDDVGRPCLDIRLITVLEKRGRTAFNDIMALKENIEKIGVVMPVSVSPTADGRYTLVAGERRLRAFTLAGGRYIPFVLGDENPLWKKEAELYENVFRENLTQEEEMELLNQIHELHVSIHGPAVQGNTKGGGWTIAQTAELTGRSAPVVQKKLQIHKELKANPKLKELVGGLPLSAQLKEINKAKKRDKFHEEVKQGKAEISTSVVHIDCLKGVESLADKSVHCWLTDAPFGNTEIEQEKGSQRSNMIYTSVIKKTDNMDGESLRELFKQLVPKLKPKLVDGAHCYLFFAFEHYEFLKQLLTENNFIVEHAPIIWYKDLTTTPAMGYNYQSAYEPILHCVYKTKDRRLSGEGLRNVMTCKPVSAPLRLHNFHKPTKLLADLISQATIEGELVLDTFAGSGAVVKTARDLHRSSIGFEIDEDNWKNAQLNLSRSAKVEATIGGKK